MPLSRALPLATCLGVVPILTGCMVHVDTGGFTAREEVHFKVTETPTIDLDTFDGPIEVHAWDKPEVLVLVETRASSKALLETIDVHGTHRDGRVTVRVSAAERSGWDLRTGSVRRSAKLIASVPIESQLRVRSGDGSIRIERVTGDVEARTDDGRIVMRGVVGDVLAETGDGSVQIEDLDGRCRVSTRDGSVVVSGRLRGGLSARSGDGSITVRAAEGSELSEDWILETGDGAVTLALPEEVSARVDASTNDGRIHLSGFAGLDVDRDGDMQSVRGVLGEGQRLLRIRTGDGSITLKRAWVPPPSVAP